MVTSIAKPVHLFTAPHEPLPLEQKAARVEPTPTPLVPLAPEWC
jgi:hypothetical protein